MKRIGLFSLALAALLAAADGRAAIVFSDSFTKPDQALVGTTADIGGTWTQTGTVATNPLQIASGAVPLATSGQDVYAGFTAAVPNAPGTYVRTRVDINVASATATGDYFLHLSDPLGTASNFYQRLSARAAQLPTGGPGYVLGLVDTSGAGSTISWGTDVLNFGQDYRLAIDWNFVAGPTNDTFALSVGGNPYLTHAWTSALAEPPQLVAANIRQGGATVAPTLTLDNLSVEYIPEPASAALSGLAGLALAALRRRR
ncbi:MAG TPA: PEP-CTERM sorting domain-containing protein [Verrucomicrobiota bacterium]|nr:PEP-CTERM sorting domain-containing protein [Verrucomicrobiota bacterium]